MALTITHSSENYRNGFVGIYSYGTWYDDTNFAMVNFTFPVPGCTDHMQRITIQMLR